MNHPIFEADYGMDIDSVSAIHYCWDWGGYEKKRDLENLNRFAGGVGGGAVIDRVREVAMEYLKEGKHAK
jgi:hypothetical protein